MEPQETKAAEPLKIERDTGDFPVKMPSTSSTGDQSWQEWVEIGRDVLAKIPDYVGQFFADYRQPLTTIGLIIAGLITVKLTLAILDAIDDIPLLAPLLQIVGLGYTGWFVWRYLWKASNRQELVAELDAIKNQIFGQ